MCALWGNEGSDIPSLCDDNSNTVAFMFLCAHFSSAVTVLSAMGTEKVSFLSQILIAVLYVQNFHLRLNLILTLYMASFVSCLYQPLRL